jgi:hypothetical protein
VKDGEVVGVVCPDCLTPRAGDAAMAGDLDARDPSLRANRDMGDKVLVRFTEHGVGRTSGVGVTQEAFQLWDVRNGKAIRCEVFHREADALEAAGLRE